MLATHKSVVRLGRAANAAGVLERRAPACPDDVVAVVPYGPGDVPDAVSAARAAAPRWAAMAVAARQAVLARLGEALTRRAGELALRLSRETGRPPWECRREVNGLVARLEHTVRAAAFELTPRADGLRLEPLGVVAILGPAPLPLAGIHPHVMAALAAGNTVVVKPSSCALATSALYAEALGSVLPPGVCGFVFGGAAVGEALAGAAVDAVIASGRAETLRALRVQLAESGVPLFGHAGGVNAAVVTGGADLERAAHELVVSAFLTSGQRATALAHVRVAARIAVPLGEEIVALTRRLRIGPGPRVFAGPLLDEARLERFLSARTQLEATGDVLLRGERLARPGWFVTPTVRLGGGPTCELGGPCLSLEPFHELDDAEATLAAARGPAAAIFSDDARLAARLARASAARTVSINRGSYAPPGRYGWRGGAGAGPIAALTREVVEASGGEPELLPGMGTDTEAMA